MTMNVLIHAGYTFSRSVHLKQVKALVMDELRFGNFDQITHHFQTGSTSMQLLGKVDEAVGQNDGGCGTASMLVCQLLQRLFKQCLRQRMCLGCLGRSWHLCQCITDPTESRITYHIFTI